ncbi:MAG TPA: hypothetical protein DIT19_02865 [Desulfonauticus sp.]|nr:MAG: putative conserved membrane protein [Desulfonauticus sp. 38_4375]HCO12150.1 hypothetical protein [Desulfonauticus sp.]
MKNYLFFEEMLVPKLITIIYWILLVLVVIGGIGSMFAGYGGFTFGKFLMGLLTIVLGAVGVRIWCELIIVIFKIYENTKKIADSKN